MDSGTNASNGRRTSAIVLAGGRSSRMGTPKALLQFGDRPLIAHVFDALQQVRLFDELLFDEIVVVAAPEQDLPALPVVLVRDAVAYQGPVAGIYHGLTAARGDVAFVTACDSAFLNADLIAHLVSLIADYDVVVPHWQDRFQPLHAVYRRSVRPLLADQLARGDLRPVHLFDKVRTRRVNEDEIRRFDPDGSSFFNMNTPEEYAEAVARWHQRAMPPSMECTVELFGVARMLAHTSEVPLALPSDATFSDVFAAVADKLPVLVGRVIADDRARLVDGYACNVNGITFIRNAAAPVHAGDRIVILSADAGG